MPFVTTGITAAATQPSGTPSTSDFAGRVLARANYYRRQHGCEPLMLDSRLTAAAQAHSEDMALNDFISHTGSDGSQPWERVERAGYDYTWVGENIAGGKKTPEPMVDGRMESPEHRANILNCNLKDNGVGYYYLENDTGDTNAHHYWTQVFSSTR